ncbi:peroxisomal targeting signal 2 receptor [Microbotryomycetes sp. JL221]|nr:peroxisomal targeting signal 2 receptor [Microbotryomycetes sp. JL221]
MQPGRPVPLKRCRTDGVAFSPFFPNKLAVAGSANFGLVGNGRLSVVGIDGPAPGHMQAGGPAPMSVDKLFETQDGLFDIAWSEMHENQLATASGDGSVKLWDVVLNDFPIRKWHEHQREVFSIDWSNVQKDMFCTSSWDCSIKLWTPERPTSIMTIPAHTACVYAAIFAPQQPSTIASCSTDGTLKLWDTRAPIMPSAAGQPANAALTIQAHPTETLSLDWNKYHQHLIATGSVDRTIRVHDLRMAAGQQPSTPAAVPTMQPNVTVATLLGHEYAVRKVAWSPHSSNILASGSYDMTSRIWSMDSANLGNQQTVGTFGSTGMGGARLERIYDGHTEFVVGVAWSFYDEGVVATASWDQECHLWR